MDTMTIARSANAKGQFVLPAIPRAASPALLAMIEEYRIGFYAADEANEPRWGAAAQQIHEFEPASLADLAAKLIIAVHFRDPECNGEDLAIEAPEPPADRLAVDLELGCVDWLLARCAEAPVNQETWVAAELAYARADAELDRLPTPYADEDADRLADAREDAIHAILDLPATNATQALRKIELAMFDSTMVRTGVDFPALLADAKRLAAGEVAFTLGNASDPVATAWESFKTAFSPSSGETEEQEEQRFDDITDTADDVLGNVSATTIKGIAAKLRRGFIWKTSDRWAERLALGEDTPENRYQLALADIYTRMAWSAIDDLDRLTTRDGGQPKEWTDAVLERARFEAAENAADAAGDEMEAEVQQGFRFLAEDRLMAMPAPDGAGLALKVLIAVSESRASIPYQEEIEADARRLAGLEARP